MTLPCPAPVEVGWFPFRAGSCGPLDPYPTAFAWVESPVPLVSSWNVSDWYVPVSHDPAFVYLIASPLSGGSDGAPAEPGAPVIVTSPSDSPPIVGVFCPDMIVGSSEAAGFAPAVPGAPVPDGTEIPKNEPGGYWPGCDVESPPLPLPE